MVDHDPSADKINGVARDRLRRQAPMLLGLMANRLMVLAAVLSWGLIVIAAAMPIRGLHAGALLFAVYAAAGAATKLGFAQRETRWQFAAFTAAAAGLEAAWLGQDGAQSALAHWAAATGGALLGIVGARTFYKARLAYSIR